MASPLMVDNESLDNDDVHVVEENAKDNDLTSRLRSVVWKHFERKIKNGKIRAFCKHCNKDYVGGPRDGTRHLNDHMKICPRRNQIEITHYSKKLKTVEDDQGNVKVETYSFDPDVTRGLIARMIIMHEYPLSCVEHEWFRKVLSSLNPMWKNVSRNTIKSDIMELYEMEKAKVVSLIESNSSKVAITTDMWTCGSQTKGYMAITTHFIDDSWTLRSQILRYYV